MQQTDHLLGTVYVVSAHATTSRDFAAMHKSTDDFLKASQYSLLSDVASAWTGEIKELLTKFGGELIYDLWHNDASR